jgi:pyruvate-ferredoxin/flavodoxin oxidoreductase
VKELTATIIKQDGDHVKVSQMPDNGAWPTATSQYEKRNIAITIPEWGTETCTQCGQCSLVCPHATIRIKVYDDKFLKDAPSEFKHVTPRGADFKKAEGNLRYTLQVAPEDCTGCGTCVYNCPASEKGALKMVPQMPVREKEAKNFAFFLNLPETDPKLYKWNTLKGSQFIRPLFEYSGACAGCGETAYVKLLTQLFGDRALIANATGCSSIYGGNLPTTPYSKREDGRGPAWNNSLFEDNAEIALGIRLAINKKTDLAHLFSDQIIASSKNSELINLLKDIKNHDQSSKLAIETSRGKIDKLRNILKSENDKSCAELLPYIDYFVNKSVWGVGGDGWAYDIGYGGLDHVLASGENVNLLVLDTEVYSNTGGQASKATPLGAVAKFAAGGKPIAKKDLGLMLMTYGTIYVASVSLGASANQVVKAFVEAEAYDGPSIVICYSHCIAHGIDMTKGFLQQEHAVKSWHWPLYRFNPEAARDGKNPLKLDSKAPSVSIKDYQSAENRFKTLYSFSPEEAKRFAELSQRNADMRYKYYKHLSELDYKID